MPTLRFLPTEQNIVVEANTKILVGAKRQKVDIRFGCAACRCGTCAVAVSLAPPAAPAPGLEEAGVVGALTDMRPEEKALLKQMGLAVDGTVRLACQARIVSGTVTVDIAFQQSYSPDETE
ncbi:MAG: 2Fe-2S iron-sulfur cluster-binding protein [Proteobacteria bacterium]|nr:2Fe-2S iron-sulfur cluster-binding protein [Pseudomonadota bacterium]